jgi:site-specific recombinase XerD
LTLQSSLSERRLRCIEVWELIKRRANQAGLPESTTCHTFRTTGITTYLENGGSIEKAQRMAAHADAKTTG